MSEGYNFLPDVPLDGPKKAEDLVTQDRMRLSFKDRNAIDEEVHGVKNLSREETPELLQESMRQLSVELSKIPNKVAFDRSQRLYANNTYINTADFRLRFLRCEYFDAKKAAVRMVNFLDFVDGLFDGDLVLQRPIQLTDFSKAEMKMLRSGIYQLLPYRDRSGRPIYTEVGNMGLHLDLKMRMKLRCYFYYVASNDVESQRKGLVSIVWVQGDFTNTPMPLRKESRLLYGLALSGLPLRRASTHFCAPDTLYFRLLSSFVITSLFRSSSLSRIRFHFVEGIERRYCLQGFGIPAETIPITDTGNIKRLYLYQWINVRKRIESKQNDFRSIVLLPNSNDVLIRAGTTTVSHPGNVFFRGMIEIKHFEFRSGSEFTQASLAENIVEEIERLKGRFLAWDNRGYWTELRDRSKIIFKVEISIRDFNATLKARKNLQNTHSSTKSFGGQDGSRQKRKKTSRNVCGGLNDYTPASTTSESDEDSGADGCCR
mmetsp:Transcript_5055/g.10465  ORF Transcript_5055/g.10465 Transcript_5055/m.10465 type:complete len:487 (-) Transcript_5055:248-1708(-)